MPYILALFLIVAMSILHLYRFEYRTEYSIAEPLVNISGTMYDPRSAYLSVSSIWAYAANAEIGRNYKDVVLAVDPAHLLTMKRTSPYSNTKTEYFSLALSDLRQ